MEGSEHDDQVQVMLGELLRSQGTPALVTEAIRSEVAVVVRGALREEAEKAVKLYVTDEIREIVRKEVRTLMAKLA